jgi:hypothetical protein
MLLLSVDAIAFEMLSDNTGSVCCVESATVLPEVNDTCRTYLVIPTVDHVRIYASNDVNDGACRISRDPSRHTTGTTPISCGHAQRSIILAQKTGLLGHMQSAWSGCVGKKAQERPWIAWSPSRQARRGEDQCSQIFRLRASLSLRADHDVAKTRLSFPPSLHHDCALRCIIVLDAMPSHM